MNFPYFVVVQAHHRPLPVEIVKLLRIDAREFIAQQLIDEITNAVDAEAPASLQPANDKTSTGLRNVGRLSKLKASIVE